MLILCYCSKCFISINLFSPYSNPVKWYFYLHFTEGETLHREVKYLAQDDIVNK